MSDVNFLAETIRVLADNGKRPEDVLWVGTATRASGWAEFAHLADFKYDNGYGGNYIPQALKVVGRDWWLERGEYDGSEWWEFKTQPGTSADPRPLRQKDVGDPLHTESLWPGDEDEEDEPAPSGDTPTLTDHGSGNAPALARQLP